MSETLGCGHPDKNRACRDCLDEAVEAIERARTYTGLEAEGCPLCTYLDGVFTAACSFHRKLAALELQVGELQKERDRYKVEADRMEAHANEGWHLANDRTSEMMKYKKALEAIAKLPPDSPMVHVRGIAQQVFIKWKCENIKCCQTHGAGQPCCEHESKSR